MAAGAHSVEGRAVGQGDEGKRERKLTPAQLYCYAVGAVLLLAGLVGFVVDANFDTGGSPDGDAGGNGNGMLQGDELILFEVNGWHNVVHVLSGILLLAAARKRRSAKTVALAFGVFYALVALIGLIDGNDVLEFIPVNPADNVLHILLSLAGIAAALASRADDDHSSGTVGGDEGRGTGRRVESSGLVRETDRGAVDRTAGARGAEHGGRELDPRDLNPNERGTGTPERRTL